MPLKSLLQKATRVKLLESMSDHVPLLLKTLRTKPKIFTIVYNALYHIATSTLLVSSPSILPLAHSDLGISTSSLFL